MPVAGRCGPGTRTPFLVISPYAKKNYVSHVQITQASIPQFIEDNWLNGAAYRRRLVRCTTSARRRLRCHDRFDHGHVQLQQEEPTSSSSTRPPARWTTRPRPRTTKISKLSMFNRTIVWFLGAGLLAGAVFAAEPKGGPAKTLNPIHLVRPPAAPLSAMARLGKDIFFDTSLSSSGKIACASCHSPDHAYGPPNDASVMLGGRDLTSPGHARCSVADLSGSAV